MNGLFLKGSVGAAMHIFFFICMMCILRSTKSTTCTNRSFVNTMRNKSIPNFFHRLYTGGFVLCARECKYRTKCKSFTFIDNSGECRLADGVFTSTQLEIRTGMSSSNIFLWQQRIAGSCANRPCKNDEKCTENGKTFTCDKVYANQANNTALIGYVFERLLAIESEYACAVQCRLRIACKSFNFKQAQQECELNSMAMVTSDVSYIGNQNGTFYSNATDYDVNLSACWLNTCNQTSVCNENDPNHQSCELHFCSQPAQLPEESNVLPEFDQAVALWKIGTNLAYRCKPMFFPDTDWACLPNGTWQNPNCKAVLKCSELFHNCNTSYTDGSFVFQMSLIQHKMVINCYRNESYEEYLPLRKNTSFSSYHVINQSNCQIQSTCERHFSAIKIDSQLIEDTYKSTSECNGPVLFSGGSNCTSNCSTSFGEFQIDVTGSGTKIIPIEMTGGYLRNYNNSQIVGGNCTQCGYCGVNSTMVFRHISEDLDYPNAQKPECMARGVDIYP